MQSNGFERSNEWKRASGSDDGYDPIHDIKNRRILNEMSLNFNTDDMEDGTHDKDSMVTNEMNSTFLHKGYSTLEPN